MAIANWGKDIIFSVSDKKVQTFKDLTRTVAAQWANHSRIGLKDQSEFIRPELQKISFTMELDACYGVKPRAVMGKIESYCEKGKVNTFVIGGTRIGTNKWKITSVSEAWETIYNKGELVRAKLNVSMEEYI